MFYTACGDTFRFILFCFLTPIQVDNDSYYFRGYAHWGVHETMLTDTVRTGGYERAICDNAAYFKDKVRMVWRRSCFQFRFVLFYFILFWCVSLVCLLVLLFWLVVFFNVFAFDLGPAVLVHIVKHRRIRPIHNCKVCCRPCDSGTAFGTSLFRGVEVSMGRVKTGRVINIPQHGRPICPARLHHYDGSFIDIS